MSSYDDGNFHHAKEYRYPIKACTLVMVESKADKHYNAIGCCDDTASADTLIARWERDKNAVLALLAAGAREKSITVISQDSGCLFSVGRRAHHEGRICAPCTNLSRITDLCRNAAGPFEIEYGAHIGNKMVIEEYRGSNFTNNLLHEWLIPTHDAPRTAFICGTGKYLVRNYRPEHSLKDYFHLASRSPRGASSIVSPRTTDTSPGVHLVQTLFHGIVKHLSMLQEKKIHHNNIGHDSITIIPSKAEEKESESVEASSFSVGLRHFDHATSLPLPPRSGAFPAVTVAEVVIYDEFTRGTTVKSFSLSDGRTNVNQVRSALDCYAAFVVMMGDRSVYNLVYDSPVLTKLWENLWTPTGFTLISARLATLHRERPHAQLDNNDVLMMLGGVSMREDIVERMMGVCGGSG